MTVAAAEEAKLRRELRKMSKLVEALPVSWSRRERVLPARAACEEAAAILADAAVELEPRKARS